MWCMVLTPRRPHNVKRFWRCQVIAVYLLMVSKVQTLNQKRRTICNLLPPPFNPMHPCTWTSMIGRYIGVGNNGRS